MKHFLRPVIAILWTLPLTLAAQVEKPTWERTRMEEEEAYTVGTRAYIYYSAPFILYNILYQGQQLPYLDQKDGLPFNVWTKVPELGNARNATRVVMPNCNTLYASAWIDLRKEPLVMEIPATGNRYFSIALMDAYSNNFSILGSRTVGPYGGKYLLHTADYKGIIPEDMKAVLCPTPLVWAIQRIAPSLDNREEVQACRLIQDGINIRPLSQLGNRQYNAATENSKLDLGTPDLAKDPLKFFDIANAFVRLNPPPKEDLGLLGSFSSVGLSAYQDFNAGMLTPAQKKGLMRGMEAGKEIIHHYLQKGNALYNGWNLPPTDAGMYGTNYLLRAAYAAERVGVLLPQEAMYLTTYIDSEGNGYDGRNNYVLHFNKDEIPEVDAFWSLILYEQPSILFYNNPMDRYQMGPQVPGMRYNRDGSLDIYIQHEKPKDPAQLANWLPAPAGPFMMTLRLYNARPRMMQIGPGLTPMPAVRKVKKGSSSLSY